MKMETIKHSVYLGIFSISLFFTIEVFAMNGGGHGSHGNGMSSVGRTQGRMDDSRTTGFQDMNRHMDNYMDQDMNRYMDRGVNRDMNKHKNNHMDDNMDKYINRYNDRSGDHDHKRHWDSDMN